VQQGGLLSVQPKKANWDLRRDVAKKLEKLDKRTQRAMIELMRMEEERRTQAAGHV
jgi:coiled-coil domain-containing protein 12